MRIIFSFTIIILTFCSVACFLVPEAEDQFTPRKVKPYDPEKAGAVIVESFDLTNNGFVSSSIDSQPKISGFYDMAEYNDCIYLRVTNYIYIFEKETMQKLNEIEANIPHNDYRTYFNSRGLAVADSDTAFLLCYLNDPPDRPSEYYLVSIDLSSGDSLIIKDEEKLGFSLSPYYTSPLMGYNKKNESIWFLLNNERYNHLYHFLQYDRNTQDFTTLETKKGFKSEYPFIVTGLNIYGNETWIIVYTSQGFTNEVTMVGIQKRSLDNPEEVLHFIDVEYLGTLTVPQSIIYDKPYIWMLAERDNQVQMLKLLPNG